MKKINLIISLLAVLILPMSALALANPAVTNAPGTIDADFFTFEISVSTGAKVTVLGGPSFVPPVTDGAGSDALDGKVEVMVGLAQEQNNVFSIMAEKDGQFSNSIEVTIHETIASGGEEPRGDITPPAAPDLDPIENPVKAYEYTITGSVEADANIYVRKGTDLVGSTQANSNGLFEVTVDLEIGKTNRFNVSAEDAAGNEGSASQAVIQAIQPDEPREEDEGFFPDVPAYHDNSTAILYLRDRAILQGYPDGTFRPAATMNRAEFAKIVVGAKGIGAAESAQFAGNCFPDVRESDWFSAYVCYAKDQGIISGYPDGEFKPANTINLAEASKILVKTLNVEKAEPAGEQWYSEFLESLSELNYLPTSFRSLSQNVNRGEMSEMIWRILEKIQDKSSVQSTELE